MSNKSHLSNHVHSCTNFTFRFVLFLIFSFLLQSKGFSTSTHHHYPQTPSEDSIVSNLYSLPSPEEIFNYIEAGNLKYNPGILSSPDNIKKYKSSISQFKIVGIYLADLSYALAFEQPAKGFEYMKVIDAVGNQQNLFPYLDYEFKERFLSNMSNIDTLIMLSDEAYDLAMENLFETHRFNSYATISVGCVLESLHLILSSHDKENPSVELMRRVADQKNLIDQLVEIIELYMDKREARSLLKDLNPLIESFDSFDVKKNKTQVNTRYDRVFIQPTKEMSLTKEKLDNLRIAISELREKWIN